MAIEPGEFLDLARRLIGEENEVGFRTAASRAYYSAFHACRRLASTLPKTAKRKKRTGSHQLLIDRLRHQPFPSENRKIARQIREIGNLLEKGRDGRTTADYKLERPFSRADAEETIARAEKIQDLLKTLP